MVYTAVVASATMRMVAMVSSLRRIAAGMSAGVEGVVRVMVAAETLMHRDRGAWPTTLRRLVD